jgi:hypothetical protein
MRRLAVLLAAIGFALASFGASSAAAQATLEPQFVQQFVGSWDIRLETPDGQTSLVLTVLQDGDAPAVRLGNPQGEGGQTITSLRRSGESLVASYGMNYQGMGISAAITMTRDGEHLATRWSFADGAYETTARGTRR